MLSGADKARLATAMTMGSRMPEATNSTSFISARPWLDVAVNVRAPEAAEPEAGAHGRVLRFHRYILGIQFAVGHQFRQVLDDMGLRGNGISRDDIGIGQPDGIGDGDGYFNAYPGRHFSSSSTIFITLGQHSLAQMPQPLQ